MVSWCFFRRDGIRHGILTTDEKLRKRRMHFFHKREYDENGKNMKKKLATNMDCGLMMSHVQ